MPSDGAGTGTEGFDDMRVNKWGAGVAIAAAVMLTGCSAGANDTAKPKPTTAAASPASDCPTLSVGANIDGKKLGTCIAEAFAESEGYAATTTVSGVQLTARYNPSDKSIETSSPLGSIIVIGDDAWVKSPSGDWQEPDPASEDPVLAALSNSAKSIEGLDPTAATSALKGKFTVTDTGERLGEKVFIVTGTSKAGGVATDVTFEVTRDYVNLASRGTAELNGEKFETVLEITEWDKKQKIVPPM